MCHFYVFSYGNYSKKVHKSSQVNDFNWNNFFWVFEKNWFFILWLNIFYQKKIVQKWEKVRFDGIFELAIVNLQGIEY